MRIHFHDGPYAGTEAEVAEGTEEMEVTEVINSKRWEGVYRSDESSAGGLCFDWYEW